jgi:hypothetical protein
MRARMCNPASTLDVRFSEQRAVATDRNETRRLIETAELLWICNVRADGRPHVTPLVAVARRCDPLLHRRPPAPPATQNVLREPSFQELSQLSCRLKLRNGVQFLECRRKRVGQTPDRPRPEFVVLWLEVQVVHSPGQMFWSFQLALHERFADDRR